MGEEQLELNLGSPREIRDLLSERGITLKKRWGQNFLFQPRWRRWIVELVDPKPGQRVWEVGPGIGALTEGLVESGADVTLFEIDHGLIEILKDRFGDAVRIVPGDAVRSWHEELERSGAPTKVVGNLPYSSGARIIASFVESNLPRPPAMVVMVQREVAERMAAEPGSEEYSSFTVLVGSSFWVELRGDVPADAFFPPPRVKSTVLTLTPREDAPGPEERKKLSRLARGFFAARRKTIRNALRRSFSSEEAARLSALLDRLGVSADRRGETLSLETYRTLARGLNSREE
ncbi:MAG: 16S rRNA (adenine(1518)-N(6)/adenine(1519)-N(6))-dimethyltransferase RsmA [Alkalispirochaetaceae bacterium]